MITDDPQNQSTYLSADILNQEACPSGKPKQTGSSLKIPPDESLTHPNSLHDGQEAVHNESMLYGVHLDGTSSEYSATTIQRYLNEQVTCNNAYSGLVINKSHRTFQNFC